MGKYHPHGDQAIYDTLVRMAQSFSLRYPLVDGQGNFGSIDGDRAAAMRYTESRLATISDAVLSGIDEETVDYTDNYDGSLQEPSVLPGLLPGLLVNGSSGIAVGMATNMAPHNLSEVISSLIMLIDNPSTDLSEIMSVMPGPDFPTGGVIHGIEGVHEAFRTGRGKVVVRGKARIEETKSGKEVIIVEEIPYQVNKAKLIESIAILVRDKKITGISHLRDESDRDGLRVVIELKKGEQPDVILSSLYKQTNLQTSFSANMVCLVDGEPCTISVPQALLEFIRHRREIITRRTLYLLNKTYDKAHILEGLSIALNSIDEMIDLIKKSKSTEEAKKRIISKVESQNWCQEC